MTYSQPNIYHAEPPSRKAVRWKKTQQQTDIVMKTSSGWPNKLEELPWNPCSQANQSRMRGRQNQMRVRLPGANGLPNRRVLGPLGPLLMTIGSSAMGAHTLKCWNNTSDHQQLSRHPYEMGPLTTHSTKQTCEHTATPVSQRGCSYVF